MPIPKIKDCIAYIESCGYKYSHYSVARTYVFYSENKKEVAFTLTEIREAYLKGW